MALTDEQLEIISDALQPLFQYLEHEVIVDLVRRIKESLAYTRTAELKAESMQRMGYSPAKIRAEALKILNADPEFRKVIAENTMEHKRKVKEILQGIMRSAKAEADNILSKAADLSYFDDLRIWSEAGKELTEKSFLPQLVEAIQQQTSEALKNLSGTTGFKTMSGYESMENLYQKELDKAMIKVCTGTYTQEAVVYDVVHSLAGSGLRTIDFSSGRSMQLDTAVKLAMRTGAHQLAGKITDNNIQQTGENLVYISKHWGARNKGAGHANHEQWQGKVYFVKDGIDYTKEALRIGQNRITSLWYATGYSVDGSKENDPLGLYGYNCRHRHYAWFEGVSELPDEDPEPQPVTINGKTYDYYAITQKQRSMERTIRGLKREREALKALDMDTVAVSKKIKQKIREYKEFCESAKVDAKVNRLRYECGTSDLKKTKAWDNYQSCVSDVEGKWTSEQALISQKTDISAFSVNRMEVNSKKYHDKFAKLPVSKKVYEAAYKETGRLLEKVDGDDKEHMIAINARTGKFVVDNLSRKGMVTKTSFTAEEYAKIEECKNNIILIHNHSYNVRPSGADIVSYAENDKVAISLIACHDGDVYAILNANKKVAKIYKNTYNEFRQRYDEDTSKVLATNVLYKINEKHKIFEVRRL